MKIVLTSHVGSAQHPYHFILGVFLPIAQEVSKAPESRTFQARECGPMSNWFSLLGNRVGSLEKPGILLSQYLTSRRLLAGIRTRRNIKVLRGWDDYLTFDLRPLKSARHVIVSRVLLGQIEYKPCEVVFINREHKPEFYSHSSASEHSSYGVDRRSIPNLREASLAVPDCTLLDPAIDDPSEVVAVLQKAKILVGQYGAGLTHMIWLPPGSTVVEISAKASLGSFPRDCYAALAIALGHRFVRLTLQNEWHDLVDVDILADSLSILLGIKRGVLNLEVALEIQDFPFRKLRIKRFFTNSIRVVVETIVRGIGGWALPRRD